MKKLIIGTDGISREIEMTPQEISDFNAIQVDLQPQPLDPLKESLTKRQINAALIMGANILSPDDFIRSILEAIVDPTERALALNDWETAPYYMRNHPLFTNTAVLAQAEMTPAQIDQLWALGWQQPK